MTRPIPKTWLATETPGSTHDEADNHLIELAVAGNADTIITHNTKDLAQGELRFPGLNIQTPAQFLKTLP